MESILLHCCCAPCSVFCVDSLRQEGIEPTAFWYNPNIHPWQEYKARRDTLTDYASSIGMELIVREEYGLRDFVVHVASDIPHRCGWCYACRMEEAARCASERGFSAFTTTLLISPYQQHERIAAVAEEMAARYGVHFLYRDFRPGFRQGQAKAREIGLYMQKYCGCVFSEEDRYQKQIQRDRDRFGGAAE
ncbi:epoxyqueuosine reductase QueH [Oscillibacter sp. MSJ-2]|uniref:Epoxyqueuosine reductase QueH n=1 Tax=Dysosmobacter acutus TaxID=2841504 RepID=A0ABS6F9A4_9FIRM|nr:epoxyqueuosine reductase QueH [Dysosmobacter acutus]MBU5626882.1 epoxyqueuosine reductase QueH [Dysosmobacter acutus]